MVLSKFLLSVPTNLFLTAAGILGIGFIIAFHEFGHFIFCKIFDVRTNSFAIGYGPKLFKKKWGETKFSVGSIPLGGYVEMATESPKGPTDPRLFTKKPLYQKLMIIFGGITFNILFAYFVLCIIFMTGLPKTRLLYPINTSNNIALVKEDSPAGKAGLKKGDKIISIDGYSLEKSAEKIFDVLKPLAGKEVLVTFEREGKLEAIAVTLAERKVFGKSHGSLGVYFDFEQKPGLGFIDSIKRGIATTNRYIADTFKAYKNILVKRETKGLGGPVMIISETIKGAAKGLKIFLLFLAIISINLAILNLIPLPILDGGQALLFTIEAIIRRPLHERTKEIIFIACWIGMLALFVYLSAKDIWRIIQPWIGSIKQFFGA